MKKLDNLIKNIEKLNTNTIGVNVIYQLKKEIVKWIQTRWYEEGTDVDDNVMRTYKSIMPNVYAGITIEIKKRKKQKYTAVTLRDTGEFWASMYVSVKNTGFEVLGDSEKMELIDENLPVNKMMGLSKEDYEKYKEIFVKFAIDYIKNVLQK